MSTQLQGRAAHGRTRIRRAYACNNTGVTGVTEAYKKHGNRLRPYFIVTPHQRRFPIDTLGRELAFRKAVELRAKHEAAVRAKKGGAL